MGSKGRCALPLRHDKQKAVIRKMLTPRWTHNETQMLLNMLASGQTCRNIAAAMRRSKNSIVGRINRLGLCRPAPPIRLKTPRPAPQMARGRKQKPTRAAPIPPPAKRPLPEPPIKGRLGAGDAVLSLEAGQCRFPIGDPVKPDFRFCCRPCEGESVYCPEHSAAAFTPKRGPT